MEDAEFEVWGRVAVDRAAELLGDAIPDAQLSKTTRRSRASRGYIQRYVTFKHPTMPADRAVWLFAAPVGHAYDFRPPHARIGAGLLQDPDNELDSNRFAAGMTKGFPFSWKTHLETKYEGYRLSVKVDPDTDDAEAKAQELATEVLRGLRNAGLLVD
ncbi:hypothetical protein DVA67_010690 [Solirubrobacter sp. CPCC 204708]|uniref:HK97 gp10 family phage protein n=1 Tax=Solirubrobacter deserti TaxID=2282478 RepID=A0ABT4RSS7_9ACTN|nr:hypothetical protein [Solirubrobacter deserti]MBE2316445.1 hypothetical protein [Solirubrobacter deserti]MDA0141648.1 hypothetical protein [Solirubrobacter deserti]